MGVHVNVHVSAALIESCGQYISLSLLIGTGTICSDLDECDKNEHNCAPLSARCKNTVGSFTCECLDGYTGDGLNCYNIDECKAGTHHCGEHME